MRIRSLVEHGGAIGVRCGVRAALAACAVAALAAPAAAFEFFDGRVSVNGYYEAQIRSIARDFRYSDGWDLTQWWNILDVEIEADLAPDGIGPFDLVTMFARVEVRYDCVWTQACGIFNSADAYRIGHQRKLPGRLRDGRRTGFSANTYIEDRRAFYDVPYASAGIATPDDRRLRPDGSPVTSRFWQTSLGGGLFGGTSYGFDGLPAVVGDALEPASGVVPLGNNPPYDDPPWYIFHALLSDGCRDEWSVRDRPGNADGRGNGDTLILNPECRFEGIGAARDFPNPFRQGDYNPLIGGGGSAALPYRPATETSYRNRNIPRTEAQGLYYPNARLQELIRNRELDDFDPRLSRKDLAWNHGQSQRDQRELKELYFDIEMFDSRLWVRAGYQTIVWGKTELFRNQDQFNPQDLALSSLPTLEESRISLWAVRGTWSFYEVGPFEDVRLEMAVNLDQYQPNDFGVCGEPYTILLVCGFSTGLIANGYLGIGLAGASLPPSAWTSWRGVEVGARLEWRWDRFSFAVTDFYGYEDIPYVSREFTYSRNVDPFTGRPREAESRGRCKTGRESACLRSDEALTKHHANQQIFATICADTLAVAQSLDPTACLANIFGSTAPTQPGTAPRVVVALGMVTAGDGSGDEGIILPGLAGFTPNTVSQIEAHTFDHRKKVTVALNRDVNDGPIDYTTTTKSGNALLRSPDFNLTVGFFQGTLGGALSDKLTDQQEALLGCGAFYETSCDLDGIDLLNMEAGVLFQSFANIQGTSNFVGDRWDTTDASRAQPGTVGFHGEPLCTRYENGKTYMLPGCRGPGDPGYDPRVDGTVTGLRQPFTGQQFKNELAAFSWNFLMGVAAFPLGGSGPIRIQDFDAERPFRKDGCSFAMPQFCGTASDILALSGNQRNSVRAGGNGRFGRRDFLWHSGGFLIARADKNNILGFSMDFAEDATKSNWGIEFTWVNDSITGNNEAYDGLAEVDLYRLTISADRPTFVNFLNANRTFFINTQWFFEYTDGWKAGFTSEGPWSIFGVAAISTGYFQDRLLPSLVLVYFVMNNSFAVLPELSYRFNENFSATVGIAAFAGRIEEVVDAVNPVAPAGARFGRSANSAFVEHGLSVIRERDEIFLRIRYTF